MTSEISSKQKVALERYAPTYSPLLQVDSIITNAPQASDASVSKIEAAGNQIYP